MYARKKEEKKKTKFGTVRCSSTMEYANASRHAKMRFNKNTQTGLSNGSGRRLTISRKNKPRAAREEE